MYGEGPIGGCDQGHSSETLSIMWALPAYWRTNPEVYYKNMEAFRWKLTLLRPFDGGMMQNPNRLELMTADPVIGTYIRTSIWITALCAERRNLAITGKPEFQAKTFRKVPPVIDTESRFLNTYVRNWSMVNAALGAKAPASLKSAIRELKTFLWNRAAALSLSMSSTTAPSPSPRLSWKFPGWISSPGPPARK